MKQIDGRWQVELNPDIAPKLRVNDRYVAMLNAGSASDRGYVKEHFAGSPMVY